MAGETARRERKVVTVVFCDLVGFTAHAESLDPEDVEAFLRPYHERVRSELERHGGTVEKFIGDAVMALFGAPIAHEDDPERAVRAALAIREFAVEEELELRVGITTGEALISLDARTDAGEGMASGDVVNTAARLQTAAPVNGVIVDETTYRATRRAIDYSNADSVAAKGKSAPIAAWQVVAAHSRFGVDVAHEARSELIGRQRELAALQDAFDRARHARTPQLVTLVGVPGIGKSRLVYELQRIVDADPDIITWRQGRCLAYGEGVTLWALGEIVKAQAGVVEQDSTDDIATKIHQAVEDVLEGTGDELRVEAHLLALLGLVGETQLGGDRHNEAFSAWRRFLEALAEQRPLVLVVEDIHWADDSLLDFLDELVDWVSDVPLLVVATARPELLDRRPGWGGGKLNAITLALSPLSDEQTADLIGRLLARPVLAAESQQLLLERAGGNPLYAEQFVELYLEQGSAEELSLPETLQGIIAARLDGLPSSEKGLLQDAAVVGKVFWASSIGVDPDAAAASLHSLERKGFVRRQRRSSLEGESEFAFAHALVRDVSYGQIPRAERARRHRAVAEWLDALGRPEDHAEMLAYHWSAALELVRASGGDDAEVAERTRLALRAAGDRAFGLNSFAVAAAQYEDALALWPEDDAERPDLLFRHARALFEAYDDRRTQSLEVARDALLADGQTDRAGEAEAFLANAAFDRGEGEATRRHLGRALDLAGTSVSPSAARVLATAARLTLIAGDHEAGLAIGRAALEMSGRFGLDELRAHALTTVGMAKEAGGDRSGRSDEQRALDLALAIDSSIASAIANNLAIDFMFDGDLLRADELWTESVRLAERFGDAQALRWISATRLSVDYFLGRWDEALRAADEFIHLCETVGRHGNEWLVRWVRGSIREAAGDLDGALADHVRGVAVARETGNAVYISETLCNATITLAARGDEVEARAALREVTELTRRSGIVSGLAVCGPVAVRLGLAADLRQAVDEAPDTGFWGWKHAVVAAFDGDFRGAADAFAAMPVPAFEARMRLEAGAHLVAEGRYDESEVELARALEVYRPLGAHACVERAETLLAEAQRASA